MSLFRSFLARRRRFVAAVALPWALLQMLGSAQAAGTVEYEVTSGKERGRMSFEWLDPQRMRLNMSVAGAPAGAQAWQVMRDGKIYSVTQSEGQTMVMELGAMMKMMGSLASRVAPMGDKSIHDVQDFHNLQPTGRRETVAGVSGEVFLLDYKPGAGERRTVEVVLSSDSTVQEMTRAMEVFGQTLAAAMGEPAAAGSQKLQGVLGQRRLGLLRMGDEFKAVRVSANAPAVKRLDLPAAPMVMPNLAGLAGLAQQGEQADKADKADKSNAAQRQKDRVEPKGPTETDAAADNPVDKAIGKALDKLFGR